MAQRVPGGVGGGPLPRPPHVAPGRDTRAVPPSSDCAADSDGGGRVVESMWADSVDGSPLRRTGLRSDPPRVPFRLRAAPAMPNTVPPWRSANTVRSPGAVSSAPVSADDLTQAQ